MSHIGRRIRNVSRTAGICPCTLYYSEFSREAEFIMRNWLTQVWSLGRPTVCCMQILETRSVSKDLRSRATDTEKLWQFEAGDEMRHLSEFLLPPPFCSIQALNIVNDADPHWEGWSAYQVWLNRNANLIGKHYRHI